MGLGVWSIGLFLYELCRAAAFGVPKSPFSFGLLLNGVIGHAIFVGFAIAWFAHRSATAR